MARFGPSEAGVALFAEPRWLLSQRCSSVGVGRLIPCCNIAGLVCAGAVAKPVVERGYVIEPGPELRQRGARLWGAARELGRLEVRDALAVHPPRGRGMRRAVRRCRCRGDRRTYCSVPSDFGDERAPSSCRNCSPWRSSVSRPNARWVRHFVFSAEAYERWPATANKSALIAANSDLE
jgi:hypothetical protein